MSSMDCDRDGWEGEAPGRCDGCGTLLYSSDPHDAECCGGPVCQCTCAAVQLTVKMAREINTPLIVRDAMRLAALHHYQLTPRKEWSAYHDPESCGRCFTLADMLMALSRRTREQAQAPLVAALEAASTDLRDMATHMRAGIRETQGSYEDPPEPADAWSWDAASLITSARRVGDLSDAALKEARGE